MEGSRNRDKILLIAQCNIVICVRRTNTKEFNVVFTRSINSTDEASTIRWNITCWAVANLVEEKVEEEK